MIGHGPTSAAFPQTEIAQTNVQPNYTDPTNVGNCLSAISIATVLVRVIDGKNNQETKFKRIFLFFPFLNRFRLLRLCKVDGISSVCNAFKANNITI